MTPETWTRQPIPPRGGGQHSSHFATDCHPNRAPRRQLDHAAAGKHLPPTTTGSLGLPDRPSVSAPPGGMGARQNRNVVGEPRMGRIGATGSRAPLAPITPPVPWYTGPS
jgi:hypothetical protein